MEDVLNVCRLPYDPRFPVVCMDESSKQLIGEVHAPVAAKPGQVAIADHEYVRQGVAMLFVEVEPLAVRRHVEVTEHRTRQDWAHFIKGMLEERSVDALKQLAAFKAVIPITKKSSAYSTKSPTSKVGSSLPLHQS